MSLIDASERDVAVLHDRAWWVVFGASVCVFCGQPAVVFYTFGLFVPAVIAAEHWTPATVASAIGPGVLTASLLSPLVGYAADRFGARKLTLAGAPCFCLGLICLGLAPHSPGAFVGCMILLSVLAFSGSPVPYAQILAGWFRARRGAALSIMFACGALGISVWPHYAAFLIAQFGWRRAYVVLGVTAGSIVAITALSGLRDPPRTAPGLSPGYVEGLQAGQALATIRFWKVALAFMLLTAVLAGSAISFPILMHRRGLDPGLATSALSIIGIMTFIGRVALGLVLDRWFAPRLTVAAMLLPLAGLLLLLLDFGGASVLIAAGLIGTGLGSEFNAAAYIVSKAFGQRSFGAIYGVVTLIYGIGSATGSALIATSLVSQVSPGLILVCALGVLLLAIGLLLTITRDDLPFGGAPPVANGFASSGKDSA